MRHLSFAGLRFSITLLSVATFAAEVETGPHAEIMWGKVVVIDHMLELMVPFLCRLHGLIYAQSCERVHSHALHVFLDGERLVEEEIQIALGVV